MTTQTSATASAADAPPEHPSLWRNRTFLTLWGGQIVSSLGSRMTATAMPLLVLALTHSATDAGVVGAFGTLPYLLSLPAGTLVDRWNLRRVLFWCELVSGVALAGIPAALALHGLTVAQIAATGFVLSWCTVFFGLAERAALPRIVPDHQFGAAIAQNEAKSRGAVLIGPPLGGVLFGLGRALPFLFDVVTYLASAVSLLFVRGEFRSRGGQEGASVGALLRETGEGLRWVWSNGFGRVAVSLVGASNAVFQALVLVLVFTTERHGAASAQIGLMLGIYGGGGLLGALVAGRVYRFFPPKSVIIGINWVWAALLPLMLLTQNPELLGLIGAATALLGPLWNVVMMQYELTIVPEELRGRVGGAVQTVVSGTLPLGSLGAGLLLASVGPRRSLLALAGVMAVVALVGTLSPAIRKAPTPPSATPQPEGAER